ncbi:pentapeptide repeat-containing protein [Halodesulfovibrio marinisediminis]|uniref:Uncharacterized protein YjbI, contains pentapeptide repeats n=1 Tax=Halodesulfovibrio marinisediminis DSM 17456 TaxID=1121457 RepID=A0A1N6I4L0_9BACT|nr:pentapeptide repeat-containing protein [Halodesulfovibrio marinisediminis]SIO26962.1 Uncharacterized protein YjbI, contains pentapeptide repeats [Halodesulfovibrio marinisediminis DSM 17456]
MKGYFTHEEYENEKFIGLDLLEEKIRDVSFFNCTFERCSFLYADLSLSSFDNCLFKHSNISLTKFQGTHFFDVQFKGCKLLGTDWGSLRGLFKAEFTDCILDSAVFPKRNLQYFSFIRSTFNGASFIDTNLAHAVFDDCDLGGALFDRAILTEADLSTAFNYSIDVSKNTITKAKFSLPEAIILLQNFNIQLI